MLHGQISRAIISTPIKSAARHFPTSILAQELHNGYNNSYAVQEEKVAQAMLDVQSMEDSSLSSDEREKHQFDLYLKHLERSLLSHPGLWYSFFATHNLENPVMRTTEVINYKQADVSAELMQTEQDIISAVSPDDVLELARRALMASRDAASLAEKSNVFLHELAEKTMVPSESINESMVEEKKTVGSRKLLERKSKKRNVLKKSNNVPFGASTAMGTDKVKRIEKTSDNNDPLRLFLWNPETKKLLTIAEEKDLFAQIQAYLSRMSSNNCTSF